MKYLVSIAIAILSLFAFSLSRPVWSQEEAKDPHAHSHAEKEKNHAHSEDHDHGAETKESHDDHGHEDKGNEAAHAPHEGHDDHEEDGYDEHKEGGGNVGPEKGILAASEEGGFMLSPAALENFEIRAQKLSASNSWTLPLSARLLSGEEVNLYRLRNGFFKRIDFKLIRQSQDEMIVSSEALKAGDEIVTNGIGFLRIAELAAFGGVAHGHSH